MLRIATVIVTVVGLQAVAIADEQPLMCFGTEPFWSLDLTGSGSAQFSTPDGEAQLFQGSATRIDFLGETLWRGSPAEGGDLVAWLKDSGCSDNMSDTLHPVTARVAHPDGRFLAGCCRVVAAFNAGALLEGANWQLTHLPGAESATIAGLSRSPAVRFESGRALGFAGCNNFSGGYELQGNRILVGQFASTMMACPDAEMAVESAFWNAFSGSLAITVEGDQLLLSSESGESLQFQREPPPQLDGTRWEVTNYNNNRHAVVGVISEGSITLSFSEGRVSGSAGCNNFNATYEIEGEDIKFGPAITTRMACEESLMTQESEFLAALTSAVSWRIDGKVLDMHRADSERAIWAVRQ
jgi:heat shock protein HslJ